MNRTLRSLSLGLLEHEAAPGRTWGYKGAERVDRETWCGAVGQVASHRDVREGLSRHSLEQTVRG